MKILEYQKNFIKILGFFTFLVLLAFILLPILNILIHHGDFSELKDSEVIQSFITTFLAGIVATIITLFFSLPAGYFLARSDFKGKGFFESIFDLPMAIPHTVIGIMLLAFVFNLPVSRTIKDYFVDNFWAIVVIYIFVGIPFMIDSIKNGVLTVDEELEHVARTLGASPVKVFFSVCLPLIRFHIVSGCILCFARGISEVGALLIMAYYPKTVPVIIMERFNNFGLDSALPVASATILFCLLLFGLLRSLISKKNAES